MTSAKRVVGGWGLTGMVLFGGRRRVEDLEVELARTRAALHEVGGVDVVERGRRREAAERQLAGVLAEEQAARGRVEQARRELAGVQAQLVETRAVELLQSAGVYEYAHPLENAVAYKDRLTRLKGDIKQAVTSRSAVTGAQTWLVNGSRQQGAKMVKDFCTLMLRAYNAEADNCVRTVKPHTRDSARARLEKTRAAIAKLGATMSIAVTEPYHRLRVAEIELTADYLARLEVEREQVRAQKEAAREEERARRDFERQKEKLLKERAHYQSAYARLIRSSAPDPDSVAEIRRELARLDVDIADVEQRAANTRAGYVYVISNLGSFGDQVVKIGMTRRLEPMDRVRELGDASVPFRFDVHALVFSHDAVGLETQLHIAFAEQRVNKVNRHREFFRTTPVAVRHQLARFAGNHLLEFVEPAEALEWRASGTPDAAAPPPPEPVTVAPPSEDANWDIDETSRDADEPAGNVSGGSSPRPPAVSPLPGLVNGQLLGLEQAATLRIVLRAHSHTDDATGGGADDELDPVAFLLTAAGEVRGDTDMVFYGQPDHDSGAVVLAADEHGSSCALHLRPAALPDTITEVLLAVQTAGPSDGRSLEMLDLQSGRPLGRLPLPAPGPSGLLQLGALQRRRDRWSLQLQAEALVHDLAGLARAAGVDVA